jgi:succinyl-CoA synthetase beta subunit
VIKAQVLAGGRGKGTFDTGFKGGVHLCKTGDEAVKLCEAMLGHRLITKQTPPEGAPVKSVMIAEAINIKQEAYFSILLDRKHLGPVMVASPDGGMDIEAVAEKTPERIFAVPIDIIKGPTVAQTEQLAKDIGFKGAQAVDAATQMRKLYEAFVSTDATQIEINPLALTDTGKVYVADAKLNFDDNAEYRQAGIWKYHDTAEEDPREVEAAKAKLNYVAMDGNIGCMVNGAGLAMATMDIISLYGESPANFLDVGGSANVQQITQAFKIITSDPKVKGILVNIFGGIMRCDVIAQGIIEAAKTLKLQVPLVVRLEGTNVEKGKKMLADSGLRIIPADNLDDAAQKAVKSIRTKH